MAADNPEMAKAAVDGGYGEAIAAGIASFGETVGNMGTLAQDAIVSGLAAFPGLLKTGWEYTLYTALPAIGSVLLQTGIATVSLLWDGVTALPGFIYETGMAALGALWQSLGVLNGLMFDLGIVAIGGIWEGIKALPGFLYDTGIAALGMLWSGVTSLADWAKNQFFRVFTNIVNGINDAAFGLLSKIPKIGAGIAKGVGLKDPNDPATIKAREEQAKAWSKPETPKPESGSATATPGLVAALPATAPSAPFMAPATPTMSTPGFVPTTATQGAAGTMSTPAPMQAAGSVPAPDTSNLFKGGPVTANSINDALNQVDQIQAADAAKQQLMMNEAANVSQDMTPSQGAGSNLIPIANSEQSQPGGVSTQGDQSAQQMIDIGQNMGNVFGISASEVLQGTFDNILGQFGEIVLPAIPELINMQGQHKVEVIINGADALKGLSEGIQQMITDQINEKVKWINNQTEGGLGP